MKTKHPFRFAMVAAGVVLGIVAACNFNDVLQVENPAEIPVGSLDDPKLLQVRLNGLTGTFQDAYTEPVIEWANFLTDEVLTGLNWEDYARVNQRIASYLEGPTNQIFSELSRSLRVAHDLGEDIRGWAAAETDTIKLKNFNAGLARSLIFAGYSATVLGENMCQSVVSPNPDIPSGEVLSQLQTFEFALPYFTEGLSIAQTLTPASLRDSLSNLARTGLARAYVGLGDWANAATYAGQVQTTFRWFMRWVDIPGGRSPLQGISQGGNFTHGIHPSFTGVHPSFNGTGFTFTNDNVIAPQTDPRIQHFVTDRTGHNGLTRLYKLIQGLRYGDYTGRTIAPVSPACPACTGSADSTLPVIAEFATDIMLADYVEAQHQYYEALLMQDSVANAAAALAFVNARRAVGNQPAVTLGGRALITELRNQRARDLFMGGFRLPDLRRWTRYDPGNGPFAAGSYFPTGAHPNPTWGTYGTWTCFPIPIQEYEGNQNVQRPVDPSVPPGI
jgi:hypothetical protein